MRGWAACTVVLAHFVAAFFPYSIFGSAFNYQAHEGWEVLFFTTPLSILLASHFAVCLFFILSGYVLSLPYFGEDARDLENMMAATIKRPIRLGGLVVFTILTSMLLSKLGWFFNEAASQISGSIPWFSQFFSRVDSHSSSLFHDLLLRPFSVGHRYNPPLWTIELELYGSFFTYAFVLVFRTSRLRHWAYLAIFLLMYKSLYHGFLFGILVADISKTYPDHWKKMAFPRVSIPMALMGLVFASYPNFVSREELASTIFGYFPRAGIIGGGYAMLGALLLFTATLLNPRIQEGFSMRFFVYLGRISFSVYAIHFLVLGTVASWMFIQLSPKLDYALTGFIVASFYLLTTISLAHWLTLYVDEPITRLANRVANGYLNSLKGKPSS